MNAIDEAHLKHQRAWSLITFGPGRLRGVIDHIYKELEEIKADPEDVSEWVDLIILAFDGAWRTGANPEEIIQRIKAKQAHNEKRTWPDWRTQPTNKAIEHTNGELPPPTSPTERQVWRNNEDWWFRTPNKTYKITRALSKEQALRRWSQENG